MEMVPAGVARPVEVEVPQVVLDVVTQYGDLLCYAQPKLQRDREVVLAAVANSSWAVKYVAEELLNDDNFALEMIRANAMTLRMLPDRAISVGNHLRSERCVALAAVRSRAEAMAFAGQELLADRSFVLEALKLQGAALEHVPHFQEDEDLVLAAVASDCSALRFSALRCQRSFVMRAVVTAGMCLEHVFAELLEDKELVLAAVGSSGLALQFVPESLKSDEEVVWCAFADPGLKSNKGFALKVLAEDVFAFRHLSEELRNDREFRLQETKTSKKRHAGCGAPLRWSGAILLAGIWSSELSVDIP
eukprot:g15256.t1